MQLLTWVLGTVFGYLCGSISSAVVVCKLMGLPDPRLQGSGNPGATNVLRIGGKKAAAITLFGDLFKGLLPVFLLKICFPGQQSLWLGAGIGAFIGHLLPLFFAFKGGKGVATASGVLIAWYWPLAIIVIAIWLTIFAITRVSSLSALIASFCAPWLAFFMIADKRLPIAVLLMVAVLMYRHKENIQRLRSGEESAFKKREKNE